MQVMKADIILCILSMYVHCAGEMSWQHRREVLIGSDFNQEEDKGILDLFLHSILHVGIHHLKN